MLSFGQTEYGVRVSGEPNYERLVLTECYELVNTTEYGVDLGVGMLVIATRS